jgi:hypothetical protein
LKLHKPQDTIGNKNEFKAAEWTWGRKGMVVVNKNNINININNAKGRNHQGGWMKLKLRRKS